MATSTTTSRRGLTLIESMIVTVVIALVVLMTYPFFRRERAKALRIHCVSHEKQLGVAFRGFGIDKGAFPMRAPDTNAPIVPSSLVEKLKR